jgi:predicted phage tail protein
MISHSAPGYHVFTGKQNISEQQLSHPTGDIIRIVPAIAGAKQGVLQTILGVVLIVVGVLYGVQQFVQLGAALVLGGISQMLFAPHKSDGPAKPDNLPSYAFNGAVNTAQQGNPVPIGYGRMVVGSQVIAAGLYVESI